MSLSVETPIQPSLAPVAPSERYAIIDIIRGFALFGVLLANMVWTSQWVGTTGEQRANMATAALDVWAGTFVFAFVDYKFYTLFTMLFGLGFAVQLSRAGERGESIVPTYVRRLVVLFFMGAAHGLLLWFGDILHLYALMGLALLLFRNQSDRAILTWSIGIAIVVIVGFPLFQWLSDGWGMMWPSDADRAQRNAGYLAAISSGEWSDIIELNWRFQIRYYRDELVGIDNTLHWYLSVMWKFLFGFYIGRRMFLQDVARHAGLFRRVFPWALLIGLIGNAFLVVAGELFEAGVPNETSALALTWVFAELGIVTLSIAYVCGLVLMYQRPTTRRIVALLAPVGRMALTNYLTHSVLIVFLFYGVGLGLQGRAGASLCIVFSVIIFGMQIALSRWWLERFRFGPAEWVWRSLTYGKMQPFRVQ